MSFVISEGKSCVYSFNREKSPGKENELNTTSSDGLWVRTVTGVLEGLLLGYSDTCERLSCRVRHVCFRATPFIPSHPPHEQYVFCGTSHLTTQQLALV